MSGSRLEKAKEGKDALYRMSLLFSTKATLSWELRTDTKYREAQSRDCESNEG
jgi:hypothetical protein